MGKLDKNRCECCGNATVMVQLENIHLSICVSYLNQYILNKLLLNKIYFTEVEFAMG